MATNEIAHIILVRNEGPHEAYAYDVWVQWGETTSFTTDPNDPDAEWSTLYADDELYDWDGDGDEQEFTKFLSRRMPHTRYQMGSHDTLTIFASEIYKGRGSLYTIMNKVLYAINTP